MEECKKMAITPTTAANTAPAGMVIFTFSQLQTKAINIKDWELFKQALY